MKKIFQFFVLCLTLSLPVSAIAYSQSCQLVAQIAGSQYDTRAFWFASLSPPSKLNKKIKATLIERNGAWFVYKGEKDWFGLDYCASKQLKIKGEMIEVVPVLYNHQNGRSAVINGVFVIKVYRVSDLSMLSSRYGFKKVSTLPNRFTAIFDTRPQMSYDRMIERLDQDRDIEIVIPVLSEPE